MGMFSKAFFKKVVFASFVATSLIFSGYPEITSATSSGGIGIQNGLATTYQPQTYVRNEPTTGPDFGCSASPTTWFNRCVLSLFYNVIVVPVSWGLGVTAILFNFSFDMSMDAGAADGSSASIFEDGFIEIGWLAIRDLINITFIFALLQVAILLIVGKSGGYQDRLKNIIIAAIFINFSYFIVTEAIKLSNAFTRAIFNQIVERGTGIADGFTTATGISALGSEAAAISSWAATDPWSLLIYLIFATILMVGFIGILLMSTAMFIGRYVVLVLCVVFSPILFLGLIWPQFENKARELKQTLVGQLLFPIIYLLMIWVGLNFIDIEKTAQSVLAVNNNKELFLDFGGQVKEIVFRFLVASALFVIALTAAKSYSQMGSKSVSRIQGSIGKGIGAVAFGGAAVAGRTVVGGLGGRALQGAGSRLQTIGTDPNSGKLAKFVGAAGGRALGRGVSLAGDKTRTASFDVRSGTVFQAIGKESGAAEMYGKAREGGYAKAQEERAEKLKKRRDALKTQTTGETAALNKAQEKHHEDTKKAADEFKAQHGVSLDEHKEKIKEHKEHQKVLKESVAQEKAKKQDMEVETARIRKMHADQLEQQQQALQNSQSQADKARYKQIGEQIRAIQSKKTSASKFQSMGLQDLHASVKAQEDLQSIIDTKNAEVRAEGQKIYAEVRKMDDYETKKKAIDSDFEKTEKSIKSMGKARAGSFDTAVSSNLNPLNIINNQARQQYFARVREEAANAGKKKK